MSQFHPLIADWLTRRFGVATEPQRRAGARSARFRRAHAL